MQIRARRAALDRPSRHAPLHGRRCEASSQRLSAHAAPPHFADIAVGAAAGCRGRPLSSACPQPRTQHPNACLSTPMCRAALDARAISLLDLELDLELDDAAGPARRSQPLHRVSFRRTSQSTWREHCSHHDRDARSSSAPALWCCAQWATHVHRLARRQTAERLAGTMQMCTIIPLL